MAPRIFNKFWITFTVVLTLILFMILLPLMVAKYEIVGALLLSPLLVVGMVLAYIHGYWVSRWLSERRQDHKDRD